MQRVLLKCPPGARYHFGRVALGENMSLDDTSLLPHSDTLFSAIISTAALIADTSQVDRLIQAFRADELAISSACFYVAAGEEQVFFLPKPTHLNGVKLNYAAVDGCIPDRKQLRRVQFISEGVWNSSAPLEHWFEKDSGFVRLQGGKFVLTTAEAESIFTGKQRPRIYQEVVLPKVRVHASDQQSGFFSQASVQLGDRHGKYAVHYYFLLKGMPGHPLEQFVKTVLSVLVDQGIGGERRVGCGHLYDHDLVDIEDPMYTPQSSDRYYANLSLFHPADEKEISAGHAYELCLRGGRRVALKGHQDSQLQRVRMCTEGAVFTTPVVGDIPNINPANVPRPPHDFLRYGKSFLIPLPANLYPKN